MAEKPNKWSREQSFFAANSGDLFTIAVVALCAVIFVLLLLTQWNMSALVRDFFEQQAASQPPRQPDIRSKPGETGVFLYPASPAGQKKKP